MSGTPSFGATLAWPKGRSRGASRGTLLGAVFAFAALAPLGAVSAEALPAGVPPPPGTPLIATLSAACGPAARLLPVHGVVVSRDAHGLRANLDAVALMRPGGSLSAPLLTERTPAEPLRPGESFDAELATCPARSGGVAFLDAHRAGPYVAGVPDRAPVAALAAGGTLPSLALVDQDGRPNDLAAQHGKILLLSFVFTRCPDRSICPAISSKFAYMQHHLDPAKYHLSLVTLDPPFDSPAVLKAYGRGFETDATRWSLLTGEGNDIKHLLEGFGLTALADRPGRYVHDDELLIVAPDGTIDRIVDTAGWNPDDAIAQAETLGGETTNPLRRLELASIADIAAFCGGGQSVGVVVLDSVVFVLGVAILGSVLVWWGRQIFIREA